MTQQLLRLCAVALAIAAAICLVRYQFFFDVQPIAFAEHEQKFWRVEAAFALLSIEFVSLSVAAITAFFVAVTGWIEMRKRSATSATRNHMRGIGQLRRQTGRSAGSSNHDALS